MHYAPLAALLVATTALAAPPSGVTAPGLERVCADQETDPDEDLVETSVTFLQDQAALETEAGAALIGAEHAGEPSRFATTSDLRAYAARVTTKSTTSDAFVIVPDGAKALSFANETIELAEGSVFTATYTDSDKGTVVDVEVYDSEGALSKTLSTVRPSNNLDVAGIVGILSQEKEHIAVVEMYGDIIMGGVALDDFND